MIERIWIGKTRRRSRAEKLLQKIWTRSADHHPGQRLLEGPHSKRPERRTHSITNQDRSKATCTVAKHAIAVSRETDPKIDQPGRRSPTVERYRFICHSGLLTHSVRTASFVINVYCGGVKPPLFQLSKYIDNLRHYFMASKSFLSGDGSYRNATWGYERSSCGASPEQPRSSPWRLRPTTSSCLPGRSRRSNPRRILRCPASPAIRHADLTQAFFNSLDRL